MKRFRNLSLQTKLILASLAVSIVPLAILGYVSNLATRQSLINAANESLAGAAVQTAANLDGFISSNLDAVRTEAQLPYFAEYLDMISQQQAASPAFGGDATHMANTLLALSRRDQLYISSYALLDKNGIGVIDTYTPDTGLDQSGRDYFRVPFASGLPYVSAVEVSEAGDQSSIYFSAPVRDVNNKIVGVLRIRYKATILQQIVANADGLAGPQSFAVLLDENHMRLADGTMPELNFKMVVPIDPVKTAALQAAHRLPRLPADQLSTNLPDFERGLTNAASNPFFAAELENSADATLETAVVAPLTNEPWLVVFAQAEVVFLAPLETQTRNAFLIGGIIIALAVLIAMGLARGLTRPVLRLTAVAEKVGAGDLDIQAKVESNDEIGKLAKTFNTMTIQLRQTLEGLAARTKELNQANQQLEIDITKRQREALLREVVYQVLRAVSGQLDLDLVARSAVETLVRLTGYPHVCLALPNENGTHWVVRGAAGSLAAQIGVTYPIHQGVIGRAFKTGQTQWVHNILDDPNYVRDVNVAGAPTLQSEVVALMRRGDYLLGALNVESDRVDAFDDDDVAMIQSLTDVIALALENARLYGEAQQEITERQQAEAKFRTLVEQIPAVTYIASLDDQRPTFYISPQIKSILGFTQEEWVADPNLWSKQIHPDDQEHVLAADEHSHTTGEPFTSEYRIFARDGHVVWLHDESRWVYDEDGKPRFTQGIEFDITERKLAEAALHESEERYALAVLGANDGLWDWNLNTDRVYFSPRWKSMLGYQEEEIGNSPDEWLKRIHPDDLSHLKADLASHLEGNTAQFESEYRMRHADGSYRSILSRGLAVRDATGHAYRMAGSQTDITIRKQAEERLAHDALHDGLTGLPNRTLFLDRLEHALKRTKRPGDEEHRFAVLFVDIDRFKLVNDSLGHALGDQLLIETAKRLQRCLRPADTVARLGGDEFVILLEEVLDAADATHIANRLQSEISSPYYLEEHQLLITASIGIAMSGTDYDQAEDLLRDADTAMYRAKTTGKAHQEIFDRGMHAAVSSLLQLEADLHQAIEKQEFRVYYQPLVSMVSGGIVGTEALLRWQHPTRGLLPPAAFITVLEETGMIVPAGEWVLRSACLQNKAWQAAGYSHLRVAVNFSARQFHIKNLAEMVKSVLNETGMNPATLELEITESTAMKDVDLTLRTLNELHNMGVGISLDDFGSGYSALSYLNKYPFHSLKTDRSFIMNIPHDSNDTALTAAIIAMAHNLKLKVVAEGVETAEQLEFLRSNDCDEVQGFLFSRPVPAKELTELLLKKELRPKQVAGDNSQANVRPRSGKKDKKD